LPQASKTTNKETLSQVFQSFVSFTLADRDCGSMITKPTTDTAKEAAAQRHFLGPPVLVLAMLSWDHTATMGHVFLFLLLRSLIDSIQQTPVQGSLWQPSQLPLCFLVISIGAPEHC
jgi:hypothetical protein